MSRCISGRPGERRGGEGAGLEEDSAGGVYDTSSPAVSRLQREGPFGSAAHTHTHTHTHTHICMYTYIDMHAKHTDARNIASYGIKDGTKLFLTQRVPAGAASTDGGAGAASTDGGGGGEEEAMETDSGRMSLTVKLLRAGRDETIEVCLFVVNDSVFVVCIVNDSVSVVL